LAEGDVQQLAPTSQHGKPSAQQSGACPELEVATEYAHAAPLRINKTVSAQISNVLVNIEIPFTEKASRRLFDAYDSAEAGSPWLGSLQHSQTQ